MRINAVKLEFILKNTIPFQPAYRKKGKNKMTYIILIIYNLDKSRAFCNFYLETYVCSTYGRATIFCVGLFGRRRIILYDFFSDFFEDPKRLIKRDFKF